ncbi:MULTISPECIES: proline iminopeptidase-family hydrolase [Lacticaseibacillus]|uniref:Proline iminopeptidase n=2 Tax=Lacticaseibacillus TaxID=2759736 RepID=A0AAN1C7B9_LACCA|nr:MULTISPECIES: proline iminopeptidase-family hydrolase [Lacticaseibacillus]ARY90835.1 prolyl aminopeptidase [Lacticaseibacillus casei]KAB1970697.1 alpha/beta fold hydrolase [Lacticaseibacillus casei]WLV81448.1 proline iminopeptidase-family hydrolase [Lacticaseibacillus sp. NCIMB 15473]WNX25409.1 proline iminopeptidase-family hydrolase [Lacticaseibacillus casei]WNX28179.1 proline iminopeptidase-family hydrolase [Lacticaseibacillus casei]
MVKLNPNGTRFVTLPNGYHLWTQTQGQGQIRLMTLHGGPGGTNEVFENFAQELEPYGVRVTRYDQLGSFFSDQPDFADPANQKRFLNIEYYVDEVENVRQQLGIDHFYLLGQSWGGVLAIEYALKYGEHLKGLVLSSMIDNLDEYLVNINKIREKMFSPEDVAYMQQIEARHAFDDAKYQALVSELGEHYLHHAADPQPRHLISTLATPVYHYFQGDNEFVMVGALKNWDRRADMHQITVPTYLTFGGHETMPLTAAERMAQTIPHATLHVTPNAGHGQMLDNPTDYFSHLGQWLTQTDAKAPLSDN